MPSAEKEKYKQSYLQELTAQHSLAEFQGVTSHPSQSSKTAKSSAIESVSSNSFLQLGPFIQASCSKSNLGQGTFGVVQIMVHSQTLRKFAVKVIRDSCLFKSLATEVELLKGFKHEALLSPVASSLTGAIRWVAFPLVPEGCLGSFLRRNGQLAGEDLQAVSVQLIDVVQYLNCSARVLHGDIKPSNILFRSSVRHIFLIDFGLSHQLPFSAKSGELYTPHYRAPELWFPRKSNTGGLLEMRSAQDAFATGCTLFELACGQKLCTGDSEETLAKHMKQLLQHGRQPSDNWKMLAAPWGKIVWQLTEPILLRGCGRQPTISCLRFALFLLAYIWMKSVFLN